MRLFCPPCSCVLFVPPFVWLPPCVCVCVLSPLDCFCTIKQKFLRLPQAKPHLQSGLIFFIMLTNVNRSLAQLCPSFYINLSGLQDKEERPFGCSFCGKKFKYNFHKTAHEKLSRCTKKQRSEMVTCENCFKSFSSQELSQNSNIIAFNDGS